eukprot:3054086-Pleurochrysis_carterae.AAC.1
MQSRDVAARNFKHTWLCSCASECIAVCYELCSLQTHEHNTCVVVLVRSSTSALERACASAYVQGILPAEEFDALCEA